MLYPGLSFLVYSSPIPSPPADSANDLYSLQSVAVMVPSLTVNPFHSAECMGFPANFSHGLPLWWRWWACPGSPATTAAAGGQASLTLWAFNAVQHTSASYPALHRSHVILPRKRLFPTRVIGVWMLFRVCPALEARRTILVEGTIAALQQAT